MPMQSDDDAQERYMQRHHVPGAPDPTKGQTPHTIANGADYAADPHGGKQYSGTTPTMKSAAGQMKGSSGSGARSSGGGKGMRGMSPTGGGKFNTGGTSSKGGGRSFGSANVSRGRGR